MLMQGNIRPYLHAANAELTAKSLNPTAFFFKVGLIFFLKIFGTGIKNNSFAGILRHIFARRRRQLFQNVKHV